MTTLLVTGDTVGKKVTFTSKNPTDPTTYIGVVSAIITPALAPTFGGDLISYTAAVARVDSSVGDSTTLNYFIVTLANNQSTPINRVFANEWIATGSFAVIDETTIYKLNVYDVPASGLPALITLLEAHGYQAVQVTT